MIKNYLKVAWRNMIRNKAQASINIIGLSVGLASSVLILLWVQNELSIDAFHKNASRLFAIYERQIYVHKTQGQFSTPGLLADELKKTVPAIEYASVLGYNNLHSFKLGDKTLKLNGTVAGADFFKMFSYPLIEGDTQSALNSPVALAISRKAAIAFFGSSENAIGKTLKFDNKTDLKITAVFEDLPKNVSNSFDFLINWDAFLRDNSWAKDWGTNAFTSYIMIRQGANPAQVQNEIAHFLDNLNEYAKKGSYMIQLGLQRYDETYLHGTFTEGNIDGGKIEYVQIFSIIAVFILIIACINFMNFTTARSNKRAHEIGVRKVVGALRPALIRQFIGEALFTTFFAVAFSLILVVIILPYFNDVTQKQISIPFVNPEFWFYLIILTIFTGLISGLYPALYLSSFNPVKVLKASAKVSGGSIYFRKGLVVFQFVLCIFLVTGTIVIAKQMKYIQAKNLGYDRDNLIYIPYEGALYYKFNVFKDEAMKLPGVQSVSHISSTPTLLDNTAPADWTGKDPNNRVEFTQASVGYDFSKTMKLQMAFGRDFSKDFLTDSSGYLINETALKKTGYKDPIGQFLTFWGKKGKIIGVIKDFHFNSLHQAISPLIIRFGVKENYGFILARTAPGKTMQALSSLNKVCKDVNPGFPFTYAFADEEYKKLYESEYLVSKLADSFALVAVIISCLGLLGLIMFAAEQKGKEIGIRKILGASVPSLLALLSSELLVLVAIALLISIPIAWYVSYNWLKGFAYHVHLSWWIFAYSTGLILFIALLTISYQALIASMANPVKSLRSE